MFLLGVEGRKVRVLNDSDGDDRSELRIIRKVGPRKAVKRREACGLPRLYHLDWRPFKEVNEEDSTRSQVGFANVEGITSKGYGE